MSLSQFEEAVGHWRGADGGPAETGHHGGEIVAPIEAVGEFGQVARDGACLQVFWLKDLLKLASCWGRSRVDCRET